MTSVNTVLHKLTLTDDIVISHALRYVAMRYSCRNGHVVERWQHIMFCVYDTLRSWADRDETGQHRH